MPRKRAATKETPPDVHPVTIEPRFSWYYQLDMALKTLERLLLSPQARDNEWVSRTAGHFRSKAEELIRKAPPGEGKAVSHYKSRLNRL